MEGLKRVIDDPAHRKEVVAGNMSKHLTEREPHSSPPIYCDLLGIQNTEEWLRGLERRRDSFMN